MRSSNFDYDKIESFIRDKKASQCTLVASEVLYENPGIPQQETSECTLVAPEALYEKPGIPQQEISECTLIAPEVLYEIPGSAQQETSEYIMVGPEVQHEAVGITADRWRCMLEAIRFKPTPLEYLKNGGVIDVVMKRKDINWVETHALLTKEPILPARRNLGHLKVKVGACKAEDDPADAPLRWVVAAPTRGRIEFSYIATTRSPHTITI
ncbi:uncharacterized protein E0L32_008288 [Thyridium curvatum]|uniref:Uncharacterized protein n=1 Tax=Thyridium curvatum TaxID=1093900 RepID=A0A507B0B7_9PEZI|nr:uncharacterized protein E0L32_008288 [Thyridium curvatum]TPX10719.1 hypothetical protein E0L32_008288 [Thyridium curvatum]